MEKLSVYVFTTKNVVIKRKPVLRIYYDEDGDLQFLDGMQSPRIEDAMLISLGEMLQIDCDLLSVVSELQRGEFAIRKDADSPWKVRRQHRNT